LYGGAWERMAERTGSELTHTAFLMQVGNEENCKRQKKEEQKLKKNVTFKKKRNTKGLKLSSVSQLISANTRRCSNENH